MEAEANYTLKDEQLILKSEGKAKAVLDDKNLTLAVDFGEPKLFSYTDMAQISEGDYQIVILMNSKETLTLSGLGYNFENFLFNLFKSRNELLLQYMLMDEALIKADFEAQFTWSNSSGEKSNPDTCEARLYETALVILPRKSSLLRIPYAYFAEVRKNDYKLEIITEFKDRLELSMLGEKFDPLVKGLSDASNKLMLRSQEAIKELIPEANPAIIHKLAFLLKDGRAAKKKDIDALSPELWSRLRKKIQEAGIGEECTYLETLSASEQIRVGIKRGLVGNLTGSYLWFLFPMKSQKLGKLDNAIAFEAFSISENPEETETSQETEAPTENDESSQESDESIQTEAEQVKDGKATYLFRIMNRQNYAQTDPKDLETQLENFIISMNRCMIDINFRREPIYISEDKLDQPKYTKYRFAISNSESLRLLRNHFIGRIMHTSVDQWKQNLTSLLDFNAKSTDELAKWKKGVE